MQSIFTAKSHEKHKGVTKFFKPVVLIEMYFLLNSEKSTLKDRRQEGTAVSLQTCKFLVNFFVSSPLNGLAFQT